MKNWKTNIQNLLLTMHPYRGEMSVAILCALLKQASVIGAAALTSYVVGLAFQGNFHSHRSFLIGCLIACILFRAIAFFGEMYFAHDVAFRVIRNYRISLYEKICMIAPAYTLRTQTGQLGQSLVADVEILELFLAHTFSSFLVACAVTVIIIVVLFQISPLLSLLLFSAALLLYWVPYSRRKQSDREGENQRKALAEANTVLVESVQGLREITTLRGTERFKDLIHERMKRLYSSQFEYGRIKGNEVMLTHLICGLFTAAVMAVSALLVQSGTLTMTMYPVAVMLSTVVLGPVMELTTVAQELGIVFAASNRVQNTLQMIPEVLDQGLNEPMKHECWISFENVSFAYEKETVLDQVSFTVAPKETVVLVGHTGAGKSTCANLLLRYWDVDQGRIMINGIDIRDYRISSLRDMISAVQQETYLFHDSVKENIRIGRKDATDEEIRLAAAKANAAEFIDELPDGYDTVTGERGYRLSGGQRQRISIARTLLRDTPIVVFDEAVSNLDTENEKYIQETLQKQLKDKTVIMIAHRLSTIVAANKIVMLDHGRVVAQGTHEDLLNNCEAYRLLIRNQLIQ